MKRNVIVLGALAVAMVMTGCKKETKSGEAPKTAATATSTAATETVLDINGEKVSRGDVDSAAQQLPPQMQSVVDTPYGKRALGDELVKMKVLEQEGRRLNVQADPEVDRQIRFETAKIVANAALLKLSTPSDAELKAQYEKNKGEYDMIQARQIVVAYKGSQLKPMHETLTLDGAVKKAEAIAAKLRAGESFDKLLSQSDAPNLQESHGMINFLAGSAPPEVAKAMASMKPGDISGAVKTTLGVHVLQLIARQPSPYEQVKPMLEQKMRGERSNKVMDDLKNKAKVTYNEKYFGPEPPKDAATPVPPAGAAPQQTAPQAQ